MVRSKIVKIARHSRVFGLASTKHSRHLRLHERGCDTVIGRAKESALEQFSGLPAADSRVLRKGRPRTPPGPEGSNGTGCHPVPQGCLAIIRRAVPIEKISRWPNLQTLTSGTRAQMAARTLLGAGRPGARDAHARRGAQARPNRARVSVHRNSRRRQDHGGADSRAMPELREGADCRSRAANARRASRFAPAARST